MHGHHTPPSPDVAATQTCDVCPGKPTGHGSGYGAVTWRATEAGPPDPWPWLTATDGARVRLDAQARERLRTRYYAPPYPDLHPTTRHCEEPAA